ncbi:MAG: class I SAM-dependent methyltransferase [Bacteriovoracia bacterium]
MKFKDLFSEQAADYAQFRPTYPKDLFLYLDTITENKELAWDCGTGNGQTAFELASFFKKVIATDLSEKQLQYAKKDPRIEYRLGAAENSYLLDSSADLICVSQAIHWFDHEKFFSECKRILKKEKGIIAFWCYGLLKVSEKLDQPILNFYRNIVGGFWEKERRYIDSKLQTIKFPFKEFKVPTFEMTANWNLNQLCKYFETWSATQSYIREHKEDPVRHLKIELEKAWQQPDETKNILFDFFLRVGINE